jgi:hypothetical protein
MSTLIETVKIPKKTGIVHFQTFHKSIYVTYDRKKTTLREIFNKFNDNYNCTHAGTEYNLAYYLEQLGRNITESDFEKRPRKIGLERRTKIQLKSVSILTPKEEKYNGNTKKMIKDIKPGMQILVKTLTGKTLTVNISKNETVESLKWLICAQEGIPIDQQRIIFAGCQLEDNATLDRCVYRKKKDGRTVIFGLEKESIVHLVLRLRGGMYHETSGKAGNFGPLVDCILSVDSDEKIV